jgi:cell division protein FtsX
MLAAVHVLRPLAAAVAVAAALTLAAGCASFDRAFGKQEAVVQFQSQTPVSVMLKVRASCSHVPAAIPERIPPHPLAIDMQDDIRYLVSNASDADLARLQQCLQRFPAVVGIEFSSPDGS